MATFDKIPPHAKMVFKGAIFEVWQWPQKMFDGSVKTFERLKRPSTTSVIATVGDKVLLQTQMQPDYLKPTLCLPGGRCEHGEDALVAAKRELLEETGYVSGNWELLLEDEPVSKMDWKVYTYIARNCVYEQEQQLDGGEKIDVNLVSFDDLVALADNPEFHGRSIKEILLRAVYSEQEREKLSARIFGV